MANKAQGRRSKKKVGHYNAGYQRTAKNKTNRLLKWSKRIANPSEAHKADVKRSLDAIARNASNASKRT